jgi:DNA polymerase-4
MSRIIIHVDLNAFFAMAEELRHPELAGRPIIVGGLGPRSVVSTASYAARIFGVHSAMPMSQARRLCPGGVFLPCDFPYYEMLSQSFFAYLRRFTPYVEEASIDEAYADMTDAMAQAKDPIAYLKNLQSGLLHEIGLTCSIGVAPTKFLAKMASEMKKPMGLTVLRRRDLPLLLYPLPIESFYGIGKKTAPRLRALGIATIGDLHEACERGDAALADFFGKSLAEIKKECEGYGSDHVETAPWDPKSIGRRVTFASDTNDRRAIEAKIGELAAEVAGAAKADGKKGRTVSLAVRDKDFHSFSKAATFREGTDEASAIAAKAIDLYEAKFLGLLIRLVGVTLANLADPREETVQMDFWNYQAYEEMDKTKLLVNELNRKLPKPMLKLAREAIDDGTKGR